MIPFIGRFSIRVVWEINRLFIQLPKNLLSWWHFFHKGMRSNLGCHICIYKSHANCAVVLEWKCPYWLKRIRILWIMLHFICHSMKCILMICSIPTWLWLLKFSYTSLSLLRIIRKLPLLRINDPYPHIYLQCKYHL